MSEGWTLLEFVRAEPENRLIHLFAREVESKKKHHYIVTDFYPYYYTKVPPTDNSDVLWTEGGYTTLFGEKVIKVVVTHPGVVKKLRAPNDYEADVMYVERFLIDTKIADKFYIRREKLNEKTISVKNLRGCWDEEVGLRY